MGPMRAAWRFARDLDGKDQPGKVARVQVDLYGSLALTGLGHGTDRAVLLGLSGNEPATIDPAAIDSTIAGIRATKTLRLAGVREIAFEETRDLLFHRDTMFPPGARTQHPNGLRMAAFDRAGERIEERTFFSIGGGFIVEDGAEATAATDAEAPLPYPFHSAAELLECAGSNHLRVSPMACSARGERTRASC